jgi:hypothetical protein
MNQQIAKAAQTISWTLHLIQEGKAQACPKVIAQLKAALDTLNNAYKL